MITATKNQHIKNLVQLNQKAKVRREQGVFVAEGLKMFLEAPVEWIREIYISESFMALNAIPENIQSLRQESVYDKEQQAVLHKLSRCVREQPDGLRTQIETVTDEVFRKISDTMAPQGILCVVKQPHCNRKELCEADSPFWVILEDLQDPGNVGTIIRAGEGAGITGVILTKGCVDIYNPKTIRATMGSIYRVPFFYTDDLPAEITYLKEQGITLYAAHLQGQHFYDELTYGSGTAFLIGNEGNGLKAETAARADILLKIPMQGQVESLNAASAATILMYETARQRRK